MFLMIVLAVELFEGIPVGTITGPAALVMIALMVITDKLIWHTRLEKCERDRQRWEDMALGMLGVAEKLTVQAEVTNEVLSVIPVPEPQRPPGGGQQ